jgi:hypothetical protein
MKETLHAPSSKQKMNWLQLEWSLEQVGLAAEA